MRGAYFTNTPPTAAKESRQIDFFILDPNFKVIYSRRRHEEGIFRFNTTVKGQYSFVFSNMKDKVNQKSVTLAIHPGYDQDQKDDKILAGENSEMAKAAGIQLEEMTALAGSVTKVFNEARHFQTEAKMSMVRKTAHNREIEHNASQ